MMKTNIINQNYASSVEIAKGVYWVGFHDSRAGLHCNPYLIVDNEEAIVIDSGSRPDFATVMMNILAIGIDPKQIKALVYQHYDPDLCGNIPNFEDIIGREDLKIISDAENLMFIRHYGVASKLISLNKLKFEYSFSSGRKIYFTKTPYAHSAGSLVTFDSKTKVLFTSDLFGSYGKDWELYLRLTDACFNCSDFESCGRNLPQCPVVGIRHFHKRIMTSTRALRHALEIISKIPFEIIAPQHGSVIKDKETIKHLFRVLGLLENVGIDGSVNEDYIPDYTNFLG